MLWAVCENVGVIMRFKCPVVRDLILVQMLLADPFVVEIHLTADCGLGVKSAAEGVIRE
jgi:hypothetical protein